MSRLGFGIWGLGFGTWLVLSTPAFAQEWIDYRDTVERFAVNFPGQPAIQDIMYKPQRGPMLKARVYSAHSGTQRYSVTVVNLTGLEPSDVAGSVAWEAWNFRKRGGQITYDAFAQVDRIDGHSLQITNPDKTRTYVAIHRLGKKLYVLEATGPADAPGLVLFQMSLQILDENGKRIRYNLDSDGYRTTRVPDRDLCQ